MTTVRQTTLELGQRIIREALEPGGRIDHDKLADLLDEHETQRVLRMPEPSDSVTVVTLRCKRCERPMELIASTWLSLALAPLRAAIDRLENNSGKGDYHAGESSAAHEIREALDELDPNPAAALTSLLAPVRAELTELEREGQVLVDGADTGDFHQWGAGEGMKDAAARVSATLDKLDPHGQRNATALELLKELRENRELAVGAHPYNTLQSDNWNERADKLIASAFPGWTPTR